MLTLLFKIQSTLFTLGGITGILVAEGVLKGTPYDVTDKLYVSFGEAERRVSFMTGVLMVVIASLLCTARGVKVARAICMSHLLLSWAAYKIQNNLGGLGNPFTQFYSDSVAYMVYFFTVVYFIFGFVVPAPAAPKKKQN
eukprot:Colp12_sorted_trinity150504_noHs@9058